MRPHAARGVSVSAMPVACGKIRPNAPTTSTNPIAFTAAGATSAAQAMLRFATIVS